MPTDTTSRKRRKVDSTAEQEERADSGAGMLDQDEVRRHMMALMQQGGGGKRDSDGEGDEDESEEESEGSESGSDDEPGDEQEDDGEDEAKPKVELELDSDDAGSDDEEEDIKPVQITKLDTSDLKPSSLSRIKSLPSSSTPTSSSKPVLKTTFSSLGISPRLITSLRTLAISRPTEIQAACIEPILQGRDCIGGAKTGSGKTMAFALPILQRIVKDPFGIFAVVLTPTRELAYQLAEQFIVLGKPLGLTTSTIVGGMDMMKQARELCSKPHIVVATPGRLVDLLRSSAHGQWDLGRVKTLVLDEADRLLTPTFAPDLGFLFQNLPEDRQTCLFTATISEEIEKLVARPPRKGKMRPFVHRVESETLTVKGLKQSYLFLPGHARDPYLYYLLTHPPKSIAHLRHKKAVDREMERERESSNNNNKKRKHHEGRGVEELNEEGVKVEDIPSTIIFTQRCATAHLLHLILTELDIPSVALHSHLSQPQRLLSLAQFRAGQVPVLVTTDVGSRGLDIPEVAMVVNFDCPRTGEDYVHRVGRTARAGRGGLAVTIVTERDVDLVKGIEEMTKVTLEEMELPEDDVLEKLNLVSTARRVANLAMQDSGFGERQAINKAKEIKRRRRDAKLAGKG